MAQVDTGNARRDVLPAGLSGSQALESGSGLKLWKLPRGLDALTALSSLSAEQQRSFSPVWRDGQGAMSGWRVASDVVIVFLPKALSTTDAQATLIRLGLDQAEPLPYRDNGFAIKASAAGLTAINQAKKLACEPGVEAAFPKWLIPGMTP